MILRGFRLIFTLPLAAPFALYAVDQMLKLEGKTNLRLCDEETLMSSVGVTKGSLSYLACLNDKEGKVGYPFSVVNVWFHLFPFLWATFLIPASSVALYLFWFTRAGENGHRQGASRRPLHQRPPPPLRPHYASQGLW